MGGGPSGSEVKTRRGHVVGWVGRGAAELGGVQHIGVGV